MAAPILITGGSGMVGHNVRDLADDRGIEVVAPTHAELDLLDADAVLRYLRQLKPRLIVHAAGYVGGIEANMREPVAFLTLNWDMGRNLVVAARDAGVERLINLGSSCMYPKDCERPLREEDILTGPLEPTNEAYAIAKCAVLRLCDYVRAETPRFQYKTLIPCNLYGRYDTFDERRSHLAAAILHKLHWAKIEKRTSVEIWGDGTARREFLYAGDLADAILAGAEHFDALPSVMNVGSGVDYAVEHYYRVAAEVVGYQGSFTHELSKPVGMKRKLLDVTRATAWGWRAGTSLSEGLSLAYRFYLAAALAETN